MFDWLWELMYSLTELLLDIINCIMSAVNKISGVETITFQGEETDFISYLLNSDKIKYAVAITSILGFILIIILTVVQIVMTYTKEKNEESPLQVAKRAAKNILILLLVPLFMTTIAVLTNEFVRALYQATQVGSSSVSQYMFAIFGEEAAQTMGNDISIFQDGTVMWYDSYDKIWSYLDLGDFRFFYSYLIGGIVVYLLLSTAMMLVERAISIVFLYIISPFVVAASVMDDGAKFKSWRDQIMIKFLTGHGAIIAINIYLMVCALVINPDFYFFDDSWTLNKFLKLLFVLGGAFAVKQSQAIVGNLIQIGAGDKAVAENDRASAGTWHALGGPARGIKGIQAFKRDSSQYGFGSTIANRLGFKTARDYGGQSQTQRDIRNQRMADKYQRDDRLANKIAAAVGGGAVGGVNQNNNNPNNDNQQQNNLNQGLNENNNQARHNNIGNDMVNNAIQGNNNQQ